MMDLRLGIAAAVAVMGHAWSATGQWIDFRNETDLRLMCGDREGTNCDPGTLQNTDEKDFAWGDVDRDCDVDLVSVNKQLGTSSGRRRNYLFINENGILVDRTTEFASASNVILQDRTTSQGFLDLTNDRDVILVDVNGDQWLDIVTGTTLSGSHGKAISHPRIYINLGEDPPGSGIWQGFVFDDEDRAPTMPAEPRFPGIAWGDIDNDGDNDLFFADNQQGGARPVDLDNRLWINNGAGYFSDESTLRMTDDQRRVWLCTSVEMEDMNDDGALDLIVDEVLVHPTAVSIVYNDPENPGFFQAMPREFVYALEPSHIDVGDLNNDGLLDIVITHDSTDRYILNTGNGGDGLANFGSSQQLIGSIGQFGGNNLIVDLDSDSWRDVLVANVDVDLPSCSTPSKIFRNLGLLPDGFNVTLTQQGSGGIAASDLNGVHDFGVFDIDGDGLKDIVIGGCTGMQVYINNLNLTIIEVSYPMGLPPFVTAGVDHILQVQMTVVGGQIDPAGGLLHHEVDGGGLADSPLLHLGCDLYEGTLPAAPCGSTISFFVTGALQSGEQFSDPAAAPLETYAALAADSSVVTFFDDIEGDVTGWTITSDPSLLSGEWEQADPNGTVFQGFLAAPENDATPGPGNVMAFVTENGRPGGSAVDNDVDGGPTVLTSPVIDLQGGVEASVSYARWFFTSQADDFLVIEISDNGNPWVLVDQVVGTGSAWETVSFLVSDYVRPTGTVQVRFITADTNAASVTEAGIDDLRVETWVCGPPCPWDCEPIPNGDVGINDFLAVLAQWGTPGTCDFNGGGVGINDFLALLANWGPCP